jgi:hypothetical protein
MATVLFTMPEGLACAADWPFSVYPGTFALLREPFQRHIEQFIARDRKAWLALLLFRQARRELRELIRLKDSLRKPRGQDDTELNSRFQVLAWSRAAEMIYERQFASFRCPACRRDHLPTEGGIVRWSTHGGASGGKRFLCPQDHTLYARQDWSAMIDRTPKSASSCVSTR